MRKFCWKFWQNVEGWCFLFFYSLKCLFIWEILIYVQVQWIVEVDIDGCLYCISIYDLFKIIIEDELIVQDIIECNSNKENSEQFQFFGKFKKFLFKGKKKEFCFKYVFGIFFYFLQFSFWMVDLGIQLEVFLLFVVYYCYIEKLFEDLDVEIEYDMDEEDFVWLDMVNEKW